MSSLRCPSCSTGNLAASKFCRGCGGRLDSTGQAAGGAGEGGEGVLARPAGIFASAVPLDSMAATLGRRELKVERGTIAAVVLDGKITEVLPPGHRTVAGWLDRLLGAVTGTTKRRDFYRISVAPIGIPFAVEARSADGATVSKYQLVIGVAIDREDNGRLLRFIDQCLGSRLELTSAALNDLLRPVVEAVVRPELGRLASASQGVDMGALANDLQRALAPVIDSRFGLLVSVGVSLAGAVQGIDLHLGAVTLPATRPCPKCQALLESTKAFCGKCGTALTPLTQPSRACAACGTHVREGAKFCQKCGATFTEATGTSLPLYTSDGQQIEIDLVVRAHTEAPLASVEKLSSVVAAAASQVARLSTWAELSTAAGFEKLANQIGRDAERALAGLGLQKAQVQVLDVRSKQGQWMLAARAELEHARTEITASRDWAKVEGERIDVNALALDLALRQAEQVRDQAFKRDTAELDDQRRRQTLADGAADLRVSDATRAARTDVALDAASRGRDRALRQETHTDQVVDVQRAQELENARLAHEMGTEGKVAEHDAALTLKATDLKSTVSLKEAETTERLAAMAREQRLKDQSQELDLGKRGKLDDVDVTRAKVDVEEAAKDREAERKRKQFADWAAMEQAELAAELAKTQAMLGSDAEKILAVTGAGDAAARALEAKYKAEASKNAEVLAAQEKAMALVLSEKDKTSSILQDVLKQQASFAAQALGAGRSADERVNQARDDRAAAVIAASDRSVTAMTEVAAAAAGRPVSGGSGRGAKDAEPPCPKCNAPFSLADRFCGACGASR